MMMNAEWKSLKSLQEKEKKEGIKKVIDQIQEISQ